MNSLEKIFTSIKSSTSKEMKLFSTQELINQLPEYQDYSLFILKSIYGLLTSEDYANRICGALLLQNLNLFSYEFDFQLSTTPVFSDFVYLQFKDINTGPKINTDVQRKEIKKRFKTELEHVDADFLEDEDMERVTLQIKLKTNEVHEKEIGNIFDFFEALNLILLSPDWNKRHGAFLGYSAIVAHERPVDFPGDLKIGDLISGRPQRGDSQQTTSGHSQRGDSQQTTSGIHQRGDPMSQQTTDGIFQRGDPMEPTSQHSQRGDPMDDQLSTTSGIHQRGDPSNQAGKTKIKLAGDLFNKIFEILKNDKFSDFQENVTSSPVREAACILLKYIYPMINNRLILHEITHLLGATDWQEQFSALLALSQLKEHFTQELVDGQGLVDNFLGILISLLTSPDEDVKFLSAGLIGFVIDHFVISRDLADGIAGACWEQIDGEEETGHSRGSVLVLLKSIYAKFELRQPTSFSCLYPSFTSPVLFIRDCALELSKVFDAEEFLYLLAEGILLDTTGIYKHLPILRKKLSFIRPVGIGIGIGINSINSMNGMTGRNGIDSMTGINGMNGIDSMNSIDSMTGIDSMTDPAPSPTTAAFAEHFIKIISLSSFLPYKEDDFACYDDTFFTPDGIKSLGPMAILDNRACLFTELVKIKNIVNFGPKTILSETFRQAYLNHQAAKGGSTWSTLSTSAAPATSATPAKGGSTSAASSKGGSTSATSAASSKGGSTPATPATLTDIVSEALEGDFKTYQSLRKMPLGEFYKIVQESHFSLFPMAYENCLEIVRKNAFEFIYKISDFSLYFQMEKSGEFFMLFCRMLLFSGRIEEVSSIFVNALLKSDEKLRKIRMEKSFQPQKAPNKKKGNYFLVEGPEEEKSYEEVANELTISNVQRFFKVLGCKFLEFNAFSELMKNNERLTFFKYTISNYLSRGDNGDGNGDGNGKAIYAHSCAGHAPGNINAHSCAGHACQCAGHAPGNINAHSCAGHACQCAGHAPGNINAHSCAGHACQCAGHAPGNINAHSCATTLGNANSCSPKENISEIFWEAMEKKNITILKAFIADISFNCLFVTKMLSSFDLFLVSNLILFSDPCFNILFVKLILKNINAPCFICNAKECTCKNASVDIRTLLSTVIASLHFTPNKKIKDKELVSLIEKEKEEVRMIIDPTLIEDYPVMVPTTITLRDYQKEGVKWIAFLCRFSLNGILADDMGLGKTVQILTYAINEMYKRGMEARLMAASSGDVGGIAGMNEHDYRMKGMNEPVRMTEPPRMTTQDCVNACELPILILCPPSLTVHWKDEIKKYFNLDALIHENKRKSEGSIVICSYDSFRRESAPDRVEWLMAIFDEGHLLKNRGTVLYSKVKKIKAQMRFILTGTPIHNSVEDLFSLFDILMPNYLGTEASFLKEYACKVTDKNVTVMKERLDALHKKSLPFIMRRLKSDVLKDLPPKIINDLSVEMGPAQEALYQRIRNETGEEAASDESEVCEPGVRSVERSASAGSGTGGELVTPLPTELVTPLPTELVTPLPTELVTPLPTELVTPLPTELVTPLPTVPGLDSGSEPKGVSITGYSSLKNCPFVKTRNCLKAAAHPHYFDRSVPSAKTAALADIFSFSGNSKILIFFQFRATIDYVLADLKIANYLRLDGSIPPAQRGEVVRRFNSEDIPYLFLTTSIGGLGLNLTSANVVVFYEHDWNPFNDLQAMDRVHRLGQRNPVSVFRLIARGTIEETVMNYQNFKLFMSNRIVTQQNNEIMQMETKDLLERFQK